MISKTELQLKHKNKMTIAVLFLAVMGLNLLGYWETTDPCNNDIVDIYYPANKSHIAYDDDCPYTKTRIYCAECSLYLIRRSQYHKFAKSYTDLGMKPPFPKRIDTENIYPPKKYD